MKSIPKLLFLTIVCSCTALNADQLVVTSDSRALITENVEALKPGKDGVVLTRELKLPTFKRGAYYRPHSKSSASGNRVEALAFNSIAELEAYVPSETRKQHNKVQEGQFILLEVENGRYLSLLPMTSEKVNGQIFIEDGKLLIKSATLGTEAVSGEIPLLIWAYGDSPYSATRAVWEQVFESGYVAARPRSGKSYPVEPYGYLGWCSWEFYKTNISEKILTDAVHTIEDCGAPLRWLMVDNGYLNHNGNMIVDFTPDVEKFPNGWEAVTSLKNPEKIKWMGVWRNMLGFMQGISPQHKMSDISDQLIKKGKRMLPKDSAIGATAFYDKMVLDSKNAGFDFTKVDFQSRLPEFYKGTANAISATRYNNEALEEATKKYDVPLLNCIAQSNVNSLQTKYSALTRSSPDYNQSDKNKNKCNTYQSFANHLWMSQTVWGDLDMFHTHDKRDVKPMAIARAISGGPVYISDEPSKINPEVLIPFAYADGKLLRTAAPATLLPESFFIHPFRDDNIFRVVAPMEDGVAAIALFNFTESGKTLKSGFTAKDYTHAGELMSKGTAWTEPAEGVLVYDREAKSAVELGNGFSAEVSDFGAKLFFLYPKTSGWAVIGRGDKYLPGAAVKIRSVTDKEIAFSLAESGPLTIWSENGSPKMEGAEFKEIGENLYLADLPIEKGALEVSVTR
ncbi:MAG: Sip1-related alpha-galactosidase [Luteolibacter sp.]